MRSSLGVKSGGSGSGVASCCCCLVFISVRAPFHRRRRAASDVRLEPCPTIGGRYGPGVRVIAENASAPDKRQDRRRAMVCLQPFLMNSNPSLRRYWFGGVGTLPGSRGAAIHNRGGLAICCRVHASASHPVDGNDSAGRCAGGRLWARWTLLRLLERLHGRVRLRQPVECLGSR